jgi:hypothetical protein
MNIKRVAHAVLLAALPVFFVLFCAMPVTVAASSLDEFRDVMARGRHALVANIENDSMLLKRDDGLFTSGLHFRSAWTLVEGGAGKDLGLAYRARPVHRVRHQLAAVPNRPQ